MDFADMNFAGMDGDMDELISGFSHMIYKLTKEAGDAANRKVAQQATEASEATESELVAQIERFRKDKVYGKTFIVCHLKDKTGKTLNGERCKVVAFDYNKGAWTGRYHGEILTGEKKGKLFGFKYQNLADPGAAVLLGMVQPSSPDLFHPSDFLIQMIFAWTTARLAIPPCPFPDQCFDSPDSMLRQKLVARYIVNQLKVDHYLEPLTNGMDLNRIGEAAGIKGLINRLEKRDPNFFTNDFSAYYLMELRGQRFPDKANKAESHLLKKGGFTDVKKNKKRLAEALTMALQRIVVELHQIDPVKEKISREPTPAALVKVDLHNKLLGAANKIDIKKALECGRITANGLPDLHDKLNNNENYFTFNTAVQAACCGDATLDFRRFNFGLTGGANLPACSICIEPVEMSDVNIAKLDCQHIFHEDCIAEWFVGGRRTCPACRETHVGLACYDVSDQLQLRFLRYIAWGACDKCQSFTWERKQLDIVDKNAFRVYMNRCI